MRYVRLLVLVSKLGSAFRSFSSRKRPAEDDIIKMLLAVLSSNLLLRSTYMLVDIPVIETSEGRAFSSASSLIILRVWILASLGLTVSLNTLKLSISTTIASPGLGAGLAAVVLTTTLGATSVALELGIGCSPGLLDWGAAPSLPSNSLNS